MSLLGRLLPSSSPTSSYSIPLLPLTPPTKDCPTFRAQAHTRRSLLLALAVPLSLFLLLILLFSPPTPPSRLDEAFERKWRYRNGSNVDVFERLWIYEPGGGKGKASLIALGASLVEFYVRDRNGVLRDISLGYDNTTLYAIDPSYPYFGSIVGRYANRIANASFTLPSSQRIDLPANEHDGRNTLHGGRWGYSRSGWRVKEYLSSSITFGLLDEEGTEVHRRRAQDSQRRSSPPQPTPSSPPPYASPPPSPPGSFLPSPSPSSSSPPVTPILLSSHLYFNLDGYFPYSGSGGDGKGGSAKGHRLWVDADRFVETDGDLIPTGPLPPISPSSGLDFRSSGGEKGALIGEKLALKKEMEGLCGSGCSGIDNALIFSSSSSPSASSKYRNDSSSPVLILSSPEGSGIRMTLRTNQPAVHLYTCNGFSSSSSTKPSSPSDSSTRYKRKASHLHQHPEEGEEEEQLYYPHQSCLAIEPEGLIDAVHHWREEDEWGYDPFYTPEREYEWWTEYAFDVV